MTSNDTIITIHDEVIIAMKTKYTVEFINGIRLKKQVEEYFNITQ